MDKLPFKKTPYNPKKATRNKMAAGQTLVAVSTLIVLVLAVTAWLAYTFFHTFDPQDAPEPVPILSDAPAAHTPEVMSEPQSSEEAMEDVDIEIDIQDEDQKDQGVLEETHASLKTLVQDAQTTPPNWQKNGVPGDLPKEPMVALVFLDVTPQDLQAIRALKVPSTVSIEPWKTKVPNDICTKLLADQIEVLLSVPMEPGRKMKNLAPYTLLKADAPEKIFQTLQQGAHMIDKKMVGITNRMGSAFTLDLKAMRNLFTVLADNDILFLDAHTTVGPTVSQRVGDEKHVPTLQRNFLLDKTVDLRKAFASASQHAKEFGAAIVMIVPDTALLKKLPQELSRISGKAALVPLTFILRAQQPTEKAAPSRPSKEQGQMVATHSTNWV